MVVRYVGGLLVMLSLISPKAWSQLPLTHDLYDSWNTMNAVQLSPDGTYLSYEIRPEKGDDFLVVTRTAAPFDSIVVDRGHKLVFSSDVRFAALAIQPYYDSTLAAKRAEVKKDKLPKDSLLIIELENGVRWHFDQLVSFSFPEKNGSYLAFLREPAAVNDTVTVDSSSNDGLALPKKKSEKTKGQELWLIDLTSNDTITWDGVAQYSWSPNGRYLAFEREGDSTVVPGLYVFHTADQKLDILLDSAEAYKHLSWSLDDERLLFLAHNDTVKEQPKAWTLYSWEGEPESANVAIDSSMSVLPEGWWLSPHQSPEIAEDGRVFLGLMPRPVHYPEDSLGDFEKATVDVWSWSDDRLMTRQLNQLEEDKKPIYWAKWDGKSVVQLADSNMPDIDFTPFYQGDFALGSSDQPYLRQQSWDYPWKEDAFVIDVKSGQQQLIAKAVGYGLQISPFGRYIIWYDIDKKSWQVHDNKRKQQQELTANLPHPVDRQDHDAPHPARPYGIGGWTENDERVLVYDEFDIWMIDPAKPSQITCLTKEVGRATDTRYRIEKVREDTTWLPANGPFWVEAICLTDKASGFLTVHPQGDVDTVVWGANRFTGLQKAKEAEVYLWRAETFDQYPEVSTWSDGIIRSRTQTNPQQNAYAWGEVELIHWTDFDGEEREGLLYYPAGFDSMKQYPMLVYYYEQVADRLHRHYYPSPSRSVINPAMYTSNGYVIFMPNIHYKIGYPGKSAYDAIMSGTQAVLAKGFVDPRKMGLQGQSWGGYQTAYMITQTNQFAAAMAGAPVSNMFSAYGGIRWGSGLSRAFQYERSQSRLGATPWENPNLYWQNSPLFFADQVETPLLMMHNDDDGAVPWYQGIEMFNALRRLDKPVWLLNYNGDKHNLTKWPNRVDLSIRMQQFFDHYLKGEPAPQWMIEGVPAVVKGKEYRY